MDKSVRVWTLLVPRDGGTDGRHRGADEIDTGLRRRSAEKIQTRSAVKSWNRVWKVNFGKENQDAYSHIDWRDCYRRVASCDVAGVDQIVSRKELVDISGQGVCGGWKARNAGKRSRRSPETLAAGGPTLRGWRDLLNSDRSAVDWRPA
ncbi:MAG TPA: hypothetical protein VFE60_03210 [Roseiarcus sp.]|jgi:hypothetical protein|nr:hypothetical protein [Roseiarcus sp.]